MAVLTAGLRGASWLTTTNTGAWLQSPGYDLGCFILSPLLGLLWLLTAPNEMSNLAILAVLGIPHYLSTFTLYYWIDQPAYYRTRWVAFGLGPLGILLTVTLLVTWRLPSLLQLAVYFWNAFHVARQSCGMLSIYRHRAGVREPSQKTLANTAIIATNVCMAVWNLAWYPAVYVPLNALTPLVPWLLWLSTALIAVLALLCLAVSLWRRQITGQTLHVPEVCFLGTSLLLFHPYLWVRQPSLATTGMLVGHFVQYLGLVWLVHRRQWLDGTPRHGPYWLGYLSTHTRPLVFTCLAIGVVYLGLKKLCAFFACSLAFDTVLFIVVFSHFYLDRLFWAFKVPQIRQSIGPYLLHGASGPSRSATGS